MGEWGKSAQSAVGAHREHLMLKIDVFRKALLTSQLFLSCLLNDLHLYAQREKCATDPND